MSINSSNDNNNDSGNIEDSPIVKMAISMGAKIIDKKDDG